MVHIPTTTPPQGIDELPNIDEKEIQSVLKEYRINNADITFRSTKNNIDDVIDTIEGSCIYCPCL
jgi:ribosome-interacting GTPase 1